MRLEIDLNKLNEQQLEDIYELLKGGLAKKVDEKVDKKEELIKAIGGSEKDLIYKPMDKTIRQEGHDNRQEIDWEGFGKKASQLVRNGNKVYKINELFYSILPHRRNIGGSDYFLIKKAMSKNNYGIRELKSPSGKQVSYCSVEHYKTLQGEKFNAKKEKHIDMRGHTHSNEFLIRKRNEMKFITGRAKHLANTLNIPYQEGLSKAFEEVRTGKIKKPIAELKDTKNIPELERFPDINGMNKEYKVILIRMLRNIIDDKGKLKFDEVAFALDILDLQSWHNFVADIMSKSEQIAKLYNVENKFKNIRQGYYDVVAYEG